MIENHNICDFKIFDKSFEPFNYLGHRDKQVIRQCIQNFSVVIGIARSNKMLPKILETGAGLSTVIFSKLLNQPGETIKTIDAFALDAIKTNSRGTSINFDIADLKNCQIIDGITIDYDELQKFYESIDSTLLSMSHAEVIDNLDLFLDLHMDDRNYKKINNIVNSNYLTPTILKNYFHKNSLFKNCIIDSYKNENDEFNFLKNKNMDPVLRATINNDQPNIIYLDSGEFSSVIEFNIIDELCDKNTLLIVQDIFFPKSIKSFLICSAIFASERWQVLWVDRTTPQGMLICQKIQ